MLSFKKYVRENTDKDDAMAGLNELDTVVERYLNQIRTYRKQYQAQRGWDWTPPNFSEWLVKNNIPAFISELLSTFPVEDDPDFGDDYQHLVDADTESLIHEYLFNDNLDREQRELFESILRKLLTDRYFTGSISDEFYYTFRTAAPSLGIELMMYDVFGESVELNENKEDAMSGLEELESSMKIAQELYDANTFPEFINAVRKHLGTIKSNYDFRKHLIRTDPRYINNFNALDRDHPDPISQELLVLDPTGALENAYHWVYLYLLHKSQDVGVGEGFYDLFIDTRPKKNITGNPLNENDKDDIMAGLNQLLKQDERVQKVFEELKKQSEIPDVHLTSHSTVWVNKFQEKYFSPPDPLTPGMYNVRSRPRDTRAKALERAWEDWSRLSHTTHSTLSFYINNRQEASESNKALLDELAYNLLYDIIVKHTITDDFRLLYREYREFIGLPRIALFPHEYGYRESVNESKEDALAGLEDLDQTNSIIRTVLQKGSEYNAKMQHIDNLIKKHEVDGRGKEFDALKSSAYAAYDDAVAWARKQAEKFGGLATERKEETINVTDFILYRYTTDLERTPEIAARFETLIIALLTGLIENHQTTEEFWEAYRENEDILELNSI